MEEFNENYENEVYGDTFDEVDFGHEDLECDITDDEFSEDCEMAYETDTINDDDHEDYSKSVENFENMTDEELDKEYEGLRQQDAALGDQYVRYDTQISQLSKDRNYYSNQDEWNNYIDEKISAQNDVSAHRYEIQGQMRAMEREIDNRKK